jgi:hypothetical protein
METKKKFDFKNFEVMSESGNGKLLHGFTAAKSGITSVYGAFATNTCPVTNNCNNGNCAAGCGGTPAGGGIGVYHP